MQRRHESQFYSSEGMRQLQRQIDELWEVIDRRVEDVKPPGMVSIADAQPLMVRWDSESDEVVTEPMPAASAPNYDPAEQAAADARVNKIIDASPALNPQPFKVNHCGRGWYEVVDSEGKPIHEGKLRKGPADEAWKAAMEGA